MDFLVSVLSSKPQAASHLVKLFSDPDSLDSILDDELIFHAVLERSDCLKISNHFYFYVLVRHVLRNSGIEDRQVADYVAEMLAEFSSTQSMREPLAKQGKPMDYIFEMLTALQTADEPTRFLIRAHVGNHSLFVSGIFPEWIHHRAQFKAAPEMEYYENMGISNYRVASDHLLARRFHLTPVLGVLSESFHSIRLALNGMSDRLLNMDDTHSSMHHLLHP